MQNVKKRVSELKFWEKNPREISQEKLEALKRYIKKYGLLSPLLVDGRDGKTVLGGNMRLRALKELGIKEVDVKIVEPKNDEEAIEIALLDNATFGRYIKKNLLSLISDLEIEMPGVDIPIETLEIQQEKEVLKEQKEKEQKEKEAKNFSILNQKEKDFLKSREKIFFAFSGGKDSSLAFFGLFPFLKENDLLKKTSLLFVETGAEFPDVKMYALRFANFFGVNLKILHPKEDIIFYYHSKQKFPSPLFRDCTHKFINEPLDVFLEQQGELEKTVLVRGGEESQRIQRLSKVQRLYQVNFKKKKLWLFNPIFFLENSLKEKLRSNFEEVFGFWEGYRKGFQRTACWFCPFQRKEQYLALQKNYPLLWEELKKMAKFWEFDKLKGSEFPLFKMLKIKKWRK